MVLSRTSLKDISNDFIEVPNEKVFQLPEKVLQFGTGVLLRGLCDYYINKANNQGVFNGRVVVVKSTTTGGTDEFSAQDSLYTHCIRGIEDGNKVEENIINASISRVLSAKDEWNAILACAENPEMEIVISNTTEVGIALNRDDKVNAQPPVSFPGKLLAFLYKRFTFFKGGANKGMVIVPTELLPGNGKKLRSIVLELARLNSLDTTFINWIENCNHFCDSLVDRIVPGKLPQQEKEKVEKEAGYIDDVMIMSEPYSLWAIETNNKEVADKLSFSKADKGVVLAEDISKFRELKLRLLNGTHTFTCGLAHLAGFTTVKQMMADEKMAQFVQQLMQDEIAPNIPYKIDSQESREFSDKVLDRFRNPYIEHKLLAITVQYSSKMKMRNIPLLLQHYKTSSHAPRLMAFGFAAHILFMNCREENGKFFGNYKGNKYMVEDDNAGLYADKWNNYQGAELVASVLSDERLWETDLTVLNKFKETVAANLQQMQNGEVRQAINEVLAQKELL
ncbi:tagaturonate reductase [Segetibacter koreensis]|uniref:tagaturonate reductase n=1 Tax=Segetibacter koreensis TaxID=398037 RepID=UPI00035CECB9|nr:tagaturonate reductase [Segetibacter koreensis]